VSAATTTPLPTAPRRPTGERPTVNTGRRRWRRWLLALGALMVVAVALAAAGALTTPTPTPTPAPTPVLLRARGTVQPVARANVGTLGGGVVDQLLVQVGQSVDAQRPVARVALPGQAELVVAPWSGTVTGINVHRGDTVTPGTTLVTVADLSRYQVETTDVDEYLIARLRPGQAATLSIEALDSLELRGSVRSVSLQQQVAPGGSASYPVVIDLPATGVNLRPGMSARITFSAG
jgi:multidrug efflux pump subunit AcrA (membrane-fusion protein)